MDYRLRTIDQKKITQPCGNQSKKHTFALGQGLYDQLLSNPPGLDRSKGRWLSGAIWVLAYFFCADFSCTTLFPPVLEYFSFFFRPIPFQLPLRYAVRILYIAYRFGGMIFCIRLALETLGSFYPGH